MTTRCINGMAGHHGMTRKLETEASAGYNYVRLGSQRYLTHVALWYGR